MAVGVHEAGHDDAVATVDHLVDVARQVGPDGLDARTVEEDVGPRQGPELVVHGEDEGIGDERLASRGLPAVDVVLEHAHALDGDPHPVAVLEREVVGRHDAGAGEQDRAGRERQLEVERVPRARRSRASSR